MSVNTGLQRLLQGAPQRDGPMRRFVILGLPRSGSTYLMTLLNTHRDISCTGEQFNPWRVVGLGDKDSDDSHETVVARDADPRAFLNGIFDQADASGAAVGGFKFMLGHNIAALKALAEDPELHIIHVWRENRLAQVASLFKALETKNWAQTQKSDHINRTVEARPRAISQRWHEFATTDFLADAFLKTLSQPVLTLEYKELFADDIGPRLCQFLQVDPAQAMQSPLVKQGSNKVSERFTNPGPIVYYFTQVGRADWLGEEL